MFFDNEPLQLRKRASLRALAPIPDTGWKVPDYPNLSNANILSFDVETKDPELTIAGPGWARGIGHIVGFSVGAQDRQGNRGAWYFPVRHEVEPQDNLEPANAFGWLRTILQDNRPKVGANLLYDTGWLTEENIFVNGDLYDVQFAEALIDETARVALETLANKYLDKGKETNLLYDWIRTCYSPNESEIRGEIYRSPPRLVGPYAESDSFLPLEIIPIQMRELYSQELTDLFRLECDLIPLLVRMRRAGVSVDVPLAERMKEELELEIAKLYTKVRKEYGELESCSAVNLAKLFDKIGVEYPHNTPTERNPNGSASFKKEFLRDLEHPIGDDINDIREHEKIVGTFLQSYVINKNVKGKLYPQFHPLKGDENGTLVGRFASSDPNLQNIPSRTKLGKRVREAFICDNGHSHWRKHDYSQIHYRILANYAIGPGSDELRQRYINDPNTDYHNTVFNEMAPLMGWNVNDPEVVKEKRRPVKNINFGLLYGQTEKSLSYKAGLSGKQAKDFFDYYHKAAPYVSPTMALIEKEAQEFGYICTLLRRRVRFNLWEPKGFGDRKRPLPFAAATSTYGSNIKRAYGYRAVNYKFQGSEPDIMKTGMRTCLRSGVFDFTGVPRITVHDELDWSVIDKSPQMDEAFEFIRHTMREAIPMRVPVKVDVSMGPNWGKAD